VEAAVKCPFSLACVSDSQLMRGARTKKSSHTHSPRSEQPGTAVAAEITD